MAMARNAGSELGHTSDISETFAGASVGFTGASGKRKPASG